MNPITSETFYSILVSDISLEKRLELDGKTKEASTSLFVTHCLNNQLEEAVKVPCACIEALRALRQDYLSLPDVATFFIFHEISLISTFVPRRIPLFLENGSRNREAEQILFRSLSVDSKENPMQEGVAKILQFSQEKFDSFYEMMRSCPLMQRQLFLYSEKKENYLSCHLMKNGFSVFQQTDFDSNEDKNYTKIALSIAILQLILQQLPFPILFYPSLYNKPNRKSILEDLEEGIKKVALPLENFSPPSRFLRWSVNPTAHLELDFYLATIYSHIPIEHRRLWLEIISDLEMKINFLEISLPMDTKGRRYPLDPSLRWLRDRFHILELSYYCKTSDPHLAFWQEICRLHHRWHEGNSKISKQIESIIIICLRKTIAKYKGTPFHDKLLEALKKEKETNTSSLIQDFLKNFK